MADISRTIEIIFGVTDLDTKHKLDGIEQGFNSVSNVASKLIDPIAGLADKLIHLEEITVALGAAFAAFSVNEAGKFESAQLNLRKVLEDTDPVVESFTTQVEELALRYGEAGANVLNGIADFKQAGYTAIEAAQLQSDALELTVVGELNVKEASELTISTLKGFGLEAKTTGVIIDSLNEVSNKYATNVKELAVGLATLAPISKATGLTFQESEGLLTPIIEIFRSGSIAADSLRTILIKLADDAKPVVKALDSLGISQRDSNGELKTGAQILREVAVKFQDLSEGQKQFTASNLVGIYRTQEFLALMNNWPKVAEVTNTALNSIGSATREANIRLESFEYTIKRVFEAFSQIGIAFGQQLLGNFTDLGKGIIEVEKAIADIIKDGGLTQIISAIQPQIDQFTETLFAVAKNLPEAFGNLDFTRIIESFGGLKDELITLFKGIFGDIDLTTVEGLTEALQKVINGITELTQLVTGIAQYYESYSKALGEVLNQTDGLSDAQRNSVGNFLGLLKAIQDLGAVLGTLGLYLSENEKTLTRLGNGISGTIIIAVNAAQSAFYAMAEAVYGVSRAFVTLLQYITVGDISKQFEATAAGLTKIIDDLDAKRLQQENDAEDGVRRLKLAFADAADEAGKIPQKLNEISKISENFENIDLFKKLKSDIESGELINPLFNSVEKGLKDLNNIDFELPSLKYAFDELGETVKNTGLNAVTPETLTAYKDLRQDIFDVDAELIKHGEILTGISDKTTDLGNGYKKIEDAYGNLRYTFDKSAESAKYYEIQLINGKETVVEVEHATANSIKVINESTEATKKGTEADKEAKKEKDALRKAAEDMQVKLAELASKEKIAIIEQLGKIDVAKIEGNTRQIEAAFKSVDNTISATTSGISDLYGTFSKTEDALDKSTILSSIRDQEKAQQEALKKQNELITTQIELLKSRQRKLESGDPLITVKADGLKANLERIYSEIFKEAQIRASEQGLNMLLGFNI